MQQATPPARSAPSPLAHPGVRALGLAVIVTLVALLLGKAGMLSRAEWTTYDLLLGTRGFQAPSERVAIVDFDESTVAAIGYPLPRQALATVVTRLADWQAELVGLDVLIPDRRDAAGDASLATAIARSGSVILASSFGSDRLPEIRPHETFARGALDNGFVNLWVDGDNRTRRMFLAINTPYYKGLSFPAALATNFLGKPLEARQGRVSLGGQVLPSDGVGPDTILIGGWSDRWEERTVSAKRILAGGDFRKTFEGRIAIVGSSSRAAKDLFATPVSNRPGAPGTRPFLSGAEIHASGVATLVEGATIAPVGAGWEVALVIGTVFLAVSSLLGLRPLWGLAVTMVLAAGSAAVAFYLLASRNLYLPVTTSEFGLLIALPAAYGLRVATERQAKVRMEAEWRQLMDIFGRYVSPDVAREIWERRTEIVLAGQEVVATVLFSDIRSYTAMTAGKSPTDVLRWLNEYFTEMGAIVKARGGFLNKFIGDGMLVVFGVPISHGAKEDAIHAVSAALEMVAAIEGFNREADKNRPALKIGVGLHTGVVTAGNVGSVDRMEYSVIGDTVNLASRLESLTKDFGTSIVVSPATYDLVRDAFDTKFLGRSAVRGYPEELPLYSVASRTSSHAKQELGAT